MLHAFLDSYDSRIFLVTTCYIAYQLPVVQTPGGSYRTDHELYFHLRQGKIQSSIDHTYNRENETFWRPQLLTSHRLKQADTVVDQHFTCIQTRLHHNSSLQRSQSYE